MSACFLDEINALSDGRKSESAEKDVPVSAFRFDQKISESYSVEPVGIQNQNAIHIVLITAVPLHILFGKPLTP